jgi:hypothetical protein
MNELLDAVDRLTKPRTSKVVQQNDAGITCTSTVELPSLLEQLDASIASSMGGNTSGASLASERVPLDTGALFEAMKVTTQIEQWCRLIGVQPKRRPADDLRAWYVATLQKPGPREFEVKQLGKWAHAIEALLDRPREKDLPDACPTCGAKSWWRDGAEYYRPLLVRYRSDDPVGSATATCRSCEAVWNARELAYILEQEDARHAESSGVA